VPGREPAVRPDRLRCRETGAATLEYVGGAVLIGIICVALLLSQAGRPLENALARAVCSILDQSGCPTSTGSGATPYEQATSGKYVALGDSYSSGEGAWDYVDGTDFDDRNDLWPFNDDREAHNRCHRSANAYSQILSRDNPFAGGSTSVACSGAVTVDLANPNSSNTAEAAQLAALDPSTSFVTMSMGGNDIGFADVVKDCIINGARGLSFVDSCQKKHDQRIEKMLPQLQATLVDRYQRIKAKAPNARVVIVGYPELFVQNPSDSYGNLLFKEDQVWMNTKANELNAMLRNAAKQAGVEFVDPTDAFRGHGIGSDDPWINDLDIGGPGFSVADPSSFHPNAKGHQALAGLVQEQLRHPRP
jgi:lysophospholipase L1-like esterase